MKYLDDQQLDKFFARVKRWGTLRDRLMFRVIYYFGLRVSECQRIKVTDICHGKITIQGMKNGKTRIYMLPEDITKMLKKWKGAEYLFPGKKGPTLHVNRLKDRFKYFAQLANLDEFSVHCLRHSCAVKMARNGMSIFEIREWLRHRSVLSTQVYIDEIGFAGLEEKLEGIL